LTRIDEDGSVRMEFTEIMNYELWITNYRNS
jgi:hypothetical protein